MESLTQPASFYQIRSPLFSIFSSPRMLRVLYNQHFFHCVHSSSCQNMNFVFIFPSTPVIYVNIICCYCHYGHRPHIAAAPHVALQCGARKTTYHVVSLIVLERRSHYHGGCCHQTPHDRRLHQSGFIGCCCCVVATPQSRGIGGKFLLLASECDCRGESSVFIVTELLSSAWTVGAFNEMLKNRGDPLLCVAPNAAPPLPDGRPGSSFSFSISFSFPFTLAYPARSLSLWPMPNDNSDASRTIR